MRPTLAFLLVTTTLAPAAHAQAVMEPPEGFERIDLIGNDETLTCMTGGAGEPVLLLHGWPQTAAEWKPILPALAEAHTVYACDLPGIRDSTNADGDFTKAGMADDIHAAFAEAGIGPMHVVGHDIGGMVAYPLAHAFPGDVATVTIMEVPLPGTETFVQTMGSPMAWHFAFNAVEEVPERIVGNDVDYFVTHFIESFWRSGDGPSGEQTESYVEAYSDPDTLSAGFEFYRALTHDTKDNAVKFETPLAMPVFTLSAGALAPVPYVTQMMEPLAETVSGGAVEGAGHWLTEEAPDETAARLLEFFAANPIGEGG